MRSQPGIRLVLAGVALLAAATSISCVDEEIVYRDRQLFEQPATEAMGMIGYTDVETKLTVCGNCHVGHQADWEQTLHASAWEGLQGSGHAQESCEQCHTVNQLGNDLEQAAGFLAVAEDRYHDVQCESCHGPGLTHVENPDATQPLAPIRVGADLTFGCGECHSDAHHPFVEDWEMSLHADIVTSAAQRPECAGCHEGKGALAAFGVNANYIEKGSSELLPITCAVCHDPHDATNTAQLRFPIETASVETHMCAQCHDRRTEPDPSSSHGLHPHAPETALLQGDAGWFPPGASLEPGKVVATHGSEGNPGLCATCHVASFDVTDPDAGFVRTVTGHMFTPIPCVDDQGLPTDTQDCGLALEDRSWAGCTDGCHGNSAQSAWSALTTATARLRNLNEELRDLLEQVDPNLDSPGGPIDGTDPTFTVAEGAFFNFALAEFGGPGRADPRLTYAGAAVHNPFFMEQLLLASIDAMEQAYPVRASQTLVRTPQLGTTDR